MIMFTKQVMQTRAKKVAIKKPIRLIIFDSFPIGGYSVEFILAAAFDYFEVVDEEVEVCCEFDVVFPDSFFFTVVFDDVFHASSSFSYRNFPLQPIPTDS